LQIARTATLPPEVKEGSIHNHNPTSITYFFFFLAAFFLAFFFAAISTSFYNSLGRVFILEEVKHDSGEEKLV